MKELRVCPRPGEEDAVDEKGETKSRTREELFEMPRAPIDLFQTFSSFLYFLAGNQRSCGY